MLKDLRLCDWKKINPSTCSGNKEATNRVLFLDYKVEPCGILQHGPTEQFRVCEVYFHSPIKVLQLLGVNSCVLFFQFSIWQISHIYERNSTKTRRKLLKWSRRENFDHIKSRFCITVNFYRTSLYMTTIYQQNIERKPNFIKV